MGKPEFVTGDMVRPGAVVIDVGVNRVDDPATKKGYRLVGDVKFDEAAQVASAITPVPGGVGPDDHHHAPRQHGPGGAAVGASLDLFAASRPEGAWTVAEVTRRARAVVEGGLPAGVGERRDLGLQGVWQRALVLHAARPGGAAALRDVVAGQSAPAGRAGRRHAGLRVRPADGVGRARGIPAHRTARCSPPRPAVCGRWRSRKPRRR